MTVQARSLGTLNLNDRINTMYDLEIPPGTGIVQIEQKVGQGGEAAHTRSDRKHAVVPVHILWRDGAGKTYWDFLDALDAQQGVDFLMGDGFKYTNCYAPSSEAIPGSQVTIGTNPVKRWYKVSFNVHSLHALRVAV